MNTQVIMLHSEKSPLSDINCVVWFGNHWPELIASLLITNIYRALTQCWVYPKSCNSVILFKPHNSPMTYYCHYHSYFTQEKLGTERLNNLPKVAANKDKSWASKQSGFGFMSLNMDPYLPIHLLFLKLLVLPGIWLSGSYIFLNHL